MTDDEIAQTLKLIDQLAEKYATDEDGHFDIVAYNAFKTGFNAGLDFITQLAKLQAKNYN